MDSRFFQLPAAASILIFFAILISLSGAFSYFLQSWSIPFLVIIFFILNLLYRYNVIDPTNKAYGLNYNGTEDRPLYDRQTLLDLCSEKNVARDEANMLNILNKWKARQPGAKPILFLVNCSGGGSRSATFTLSILQRLDSLSGGRLMREDLSYDGRLGRDAGRCLFPGAFPPAGCRRYDDPFAGPALCQRYLGGSAQHALFVFCCAGPCLSGAKICRGRS